MSDNKLDKIVASLITGTMTREEVIAAAECTPKAFASYLTSLRNAAKYSKTNICPIEKTVGDKKVMVMGTYEEFEGLKLMSAAATSASVDEKPLAERHATAVKNANKAATALARFQARKDNGEKFEKGGLDDLKFQVAKLNVQITQKIIENLPALPEVDEAVEEVGVVTDTEDQLM